MYIRMIGLERVIDLKQKRGGRERGRNSLFHSSVNLIQLLNDYCCSSPAAIANCRDAIFAWLKLVEESGKDTRTRAPDCMSERDCTT
jgi:hypothetical protein